MTQKQKYLSTTAVYHLAQNIKYSTYGTRGKIHSRLQNGMIHVYHVIKVCTMSCHNM